MNIGIDARVLEKKMTGIGRYLSDILNAFQNHEENNYYLFSSKQINYSSDSFIKIKTGNVKYLNKLFSPLWLNFVLPSLVDKHNIDIFFSPNHLLPVKKLKCKSIVVIHDLHHLINKKNHSFFYRTYLNFQLPFSIKNSDVIITISEGTKEDLINYYNVDAGKITVIYRAAEKKFNPQADSHLELNILKEKLQLPEKFILYVGMIENRKNILGILKTSDILISKNIDIKFVLVGKPGFGFKSIEKEITKRKNVLYLNYVEEDDIVSIYNLAFIFFFPSFYEGFGLPPLEAMQCGVPVLCSNITALKEVVGNNGFLRDPEDYNGFAEDIIKLLKDPDIYSEMKVRSINQSKKFSIDEATDKLFQIIDELKKNN